MIEELFMAVVNRIDTCAGKAIETNTLSGQLKVHAYSPIDSSRASSSGILCSMTSNTTGVLSLM
jgi:hypothetical protein